MPDDVTPVVVGDGHLGILLHQILLDLLHRCGRRASVGDVLQLLVDDGIQLLIALRIGIIRDLHRGVGLIVAIELEVDADTIGTALLLTYGIGISDGEAALQEVEFQVTLWREGHVGRQEDTDIGQWRGLLLGEFHHLLTVYDARDVTIVGLLMLAGSGKRRQILAKQLAQLLLVVIADNNGLEVGGISKPLLVDLEDAVIAHLVERLLGDGFHTRMVSVEDGTDRVAIVHLGRGIAVGEERIVTVHQCGKGNCVLAWLCEIEPNQLEHRFHILRRRAGTDGLSLAAH